MMDPLMILVSILSRGVPCVSHTRRKQRAENRDYAIKYEQPLETPSAPKSSWQAVGDLMPQLRNPGTERTLAFWEKSEAPLPSQNVYEILLTQSSSVLFLNVANDRFLYVTVLLLG